MMIVKSQLCLRLTFSLEENKKNKTQTMRIHRRTPGGGGSRILLLLKMSDGRLNVVHPLNFIVMAERSDDE